MDNALKKFNINQSEINYYKGPTLEENCMRLKPDSSEEAVKAVFFDKVIRKSENQLGTLWQIEGTNFKIWFANHKLKDFSCFKEHLYSFTTNDYEPNRKNRKILEHFKIEADKLNYCTKNEDCASFRGEFPYGCWYLVNKNEFDKLLRMYQTALRETKRGSLIESGTCMASGKDPFCSKNKCDLPDTYFKFEH